MEIAPHPHRDIHPQALLGKYESVLRNRMGDRNFETRFAQEIRVNPGNPKVMPKLLRRLMHWVFLTVLNVSLSLIGKRRKAVESCWKTQTVFNTIELERTSDLKPLRILHLSDFHLDTNLQQAPIWAELIGKLEYDVAVITGDFFNGYHLPDSEELEALKTVIGAIQTPVCGILGNHDCIFSVPSLEATGVKILLNESVEANVAGQKVLITGLDDSHFFQSDDLEYATRELKPHQERYALNLILAHSPKTVKTLSEAGYDVCLSGHTHGGQLCTSNGLPLLRNGLYHPDTVAGAWKIGDLHGYTSRGTGTGRLAYRLNCQPEIVLHEIRHF